MVIYLLYTTMRWMILCLLQHNAKGEEKEKTGFVVKRLAIYNMKWQAIRNLHERQSTATWRLAERIYPLKSYFGGRVWTNLMPILHGVSSSNLQLPASRLWLGLQTQERSCRLKKKKKNKVRRVHPWTVKSGTTPVITARKIDRTVLPPQADHAPHFFLCNIHCQPMFLWSLRSGIYFVFVDTSGTISSLPGGAKWSCTKPKQPLSTSDLLLDYRAARSEYTASICEKKSPRKRRNST